MYTFPQRTFGEFGIIWQAVVGALQHGVYGGAAAKKYSATEKYLKKQKHTQELTHAQQTELKLKELALKEQLLDVEGQTKLEETQNIKRLVIITTITLLLITILGLSIYYSLGT